MKQEISAPTPSGGRRGRPTLPEHQCRRHRVTITLNVEELALFRRNCGELEATDYLRSIALRGRRPTLPVPAVNRVEFIRLYQLERLLETGWLRIAEVSAQDEAARVLLELLGQVRGEVGALRQSLLKGAR